MKIYTEIIDRIDEWWSTYGVPTEGYDKIETKNEYKKQ